LARAAASDRAKCIALVTIALLGLSTWSLARAQDGVRQGTGKVGRDHAETLPPTVSTMRPTPLATPRLPLVSDSRFDEGMEQINARNPERAIALMEPILAMFETRYAPEKRRIYCAVTREQGIAYLAQAARDERDAIAIEPAWCRAQYVRAYALIDLDRLDEAKVAFERLVDLAPQNSRYLNELGYILQLRKQWQGSLDVYRRSKPLIASAWRSTPATSGRAGRSNISLRSARTGSDYCRARTS
jgi:tetratricopeptide (TPR) repeat protein